MSIQRYTWFILACALFASPLYSMGAKAQREVGAQQVTSKVNEIRKAKSISDAYNIAYTFLTEQQPQQRGIKERILKAITTNKNMPEPQQREASTMYKDLFKTLKDNKYQVGALDASYIEWKGDQLKFDKSTINTVADMYQQARDFLLKNKNVLDVDQAQQIVAVGADEADDMADKYELEAEDVQNVSALFQNALEQYGIQGLPEKYADVVLAFNVRQVDDKNDEQAVYDAIKQSAQELIDKGIAGGRDSVEEYMSKSAKRALQDAGVLEQGQVKNVADNTFEFLQANNIAGLPGTYEELQDAIAAPEEEEEEVVTPATKFINSIKNAGINSAEGVYNRYFEFVKNEDWDDEILADPSQMYSDAGYSDDFVKNTVTPVHTLMNNYYGEFDQSERPANFSQMVQQYYSNMLSQKDNAEDAYTLTRYVLQLDPKAKEELSSYLGSLKANDYRQIDSVLRRFLQDPMNKQPQDLPKKLEDLKSKVRANIFSRRFNETLTGKESPKESEAIEVAKQASEKQIYDALITSLKAISDYSNITQKFINTQVADRLEKTHKLTQDNLGHKRIGNVRQYIADYLGEGNSFEDLKQLSYEKLPKQAAPQKPTLTEQMRNHVTQARGQLDAFEAASEQEKQGELTSAIDHLGKAWQLHTKNEAANLLGQDYANNQNISNAIRGCIADIVAHLWNQYADKKDGQETIDQVMRHSSSWLSSATLKPIVNGLYLGQDPFSNIYNIMYYAQPQQYQLQARGDFKLTDVFKNQVILAVQNLQGDDVRQIMRPVGTGIADAAFAKAQEIVGEEQIADSLKQDENNSPIIQYLKQYHPTIKMILPGNYDKPVDINALGTAYHLRHQQYLMEQNPQSSAVIQQANEKWDELSDVSQHYTNYAWFRKAMHHFVTGVNALIGNNLKGVRNTTAGAEYVNIINRLRQLSVWGDITAEANASNLTQENINTLMGQAGAPQQPQPPQQQQPQPQPEQPAAPQQVEQGLPEVPEEGTLLEVNELQNKLAEAAEVDVANLDEQLGDVIEERVRNNKITEGDVNKWITWLNDNKTKYSPDDQEVISNIKAALEAGIEQE